MKNFRSGLVTAAAADTVQHAARSRDTRTITAACRVAAAISHGALTGIALHAERAEKSDAEATGGIFRTVEAPKFPPIRCIGCED